MPRGTRPATPARPIDAALPEAGRTLGEALSRCDLRPLIRQVREVGAERKAVLHALRAALERGNDQEALRLARQLTGLPD